MAAEVERLIRETLERPDLPDAERDILTRQLSELETHTQLFYLDFEAFPKTEAQVKEELARQADKYLKLSLNKHPKITMSKGKFKDSIIGLGGAQPENYSGKFDIPVIVLGQVPPKDIYEAAGVDYYLKGLEVVDWPKDPFSYKTPATFYLTWMQDGAKNLDSKVEDVRKTLGELTRGATEFDGASLYVAHPRVLDYHFIDFPGTDVGRGRAPLLNLWNGQPKVNYNWVDNANPKYACALCDSLSRFSPRRCFV